MRTGKDIILATKSYAADFTAKSWAHVLSTAFHLLLVRSAQPAGAETCYVVSTMRDLEEEVEELRAGLASTAAERQM
jgi:hypothetical protein